MSLRIFKLCKITRVMLLSIILAWILTVSCGNTFNDREMHDVNVLRFAPDDLPVVLICCCDKSGIELATASLARAEGFQPSQLHIFQDALGKYPEVDAVLSRLEHEGLFQQAHWHTHIHTSEQAPAHVRIAEHYSFVLSTMLGHGTEFDRIVVVEEDLIVGRGFLNYFSVVAPLVDQDATLLAASAWNDHGFIGMVRDDYSDGMQPTEPTTMGIHRAEHFPGLGWLCTRRLWAELESKWPNFVWDVWLRTVAAGRHTLVPEVPLVQHLGLLGSSMHLVDHTKWFNSTAFSDDAWTTTKQVPRSSTCLEDSKQCARHSTETTKELAAMSFLASAPRKLASTLSEITYRATIVAELTASTPAENFWDLFRASPRGSTSAHSSRLEKMFAMSWRLCYDPKAWSSFASYLGLWPRLPLESLPLRGLTFEGVTRFRWNISSAAASSTRSLATVFLISMASPHYNLSERVQCINEDMLNIALPPPPRAVPSRPAGLETSAVNIRARLRLRPSAFNESCAAACARRHLWCGPDVLPHGRGGSVTAGGLAALGNVLNRTEAEPAAAVVAAINFCPALVENFGSQCTGGCVEVETPEQGPANRLLPTLWRNEQGGTHCLISDEKKPLAFDCSRKSPHTKRLCPCLVT